MTIAKISDISGSTVLKFNNFITQNYDTYILDEYTAEDIVMISDMCELYKQYNRRETFYPKQCLSQL